MSDRRVERISRQLLSAITMLNYAVIEAEALSELALADDLHPHLRELREISERLIKRGRKYRAS